MITQHALALARQQGPCGTACADLDHEAVELGRHRDLAPPAPRVTALVTDKRSSVVPSPKSLEYPGPPIIRSYAPDIAKYSFGGIGHVLDPRPSIIQAAANSPICLSCRDGVRAS